MSLDKKKKEKIENFAEFIKKNREKEKKEKEKQKNKFSIKISDFEKDITRERINKINSSEKKNNYPRIKRSFSTNTQKNKKENNTISNSYSLVYKNKKEYPISKKNSFTNLNNRNQSKSLSKQNSASKIKKLNIELEENKNNNKILIQPEKIYKNPIRIKDFRDISSIFKNREYNFSKDYNFKTESNNISYIKKPLNSSRNNTNKKEKRNLTSIPNENNINNNKKNTTLDYKIKLKTKENNQKEISQKSLNKPISKAEEISKSYINQKNNLLYSILGEDTIKILQRKK